MKMRKLYLMLLCLSVSFGLLYAEDIYVAGGKKLKNGVGSADTDAIFTAGYWKNGVFTQLGSGTRTSYATSIVISGNDIYVGGYESNGTVNVAKCWKNGIEINAYSNGTKASQIQSIFVNGTDVHLAGYNTNVTSPSRLPYYWKSDMVTVPATLTTTILGDKATYSSARSVFVSDGNVYVAGQENSPAAPTGTGLSIAKYWKDETAVVLSGLATSTMYATSIFVLGTGENTNVYVAGYEFTNATGGNINIPKYWKNGTVMNLTSGTNAATGEVTAGSIFVSDTAVYVAGYEAGTSATNFVAKCWKNGANGITETILTGTDFTKAKGKAVYGYNNHVYVAGWGATATAGSLAVYWKDGIETILETTPGDALAIMVVDTPLGTGIRSGDRKSDVKVVYDNLNNKIITEGIEDNAILTLFDLNGKLLCSKSILSNNIILDGKLKAGIYFANIVSGNETIKCKFIKNNE